MRIRKEKQCKQCQIIFLSSGSNYCNACYYIKNSKQWAIENKDKVRKSCREWYKKDRAKNPEKHKLKARQRTLYKYGIDENFYQLEKINGCKICFSKDRLHIDHCHTTMKYRGLLCHHCNTGLGLFKDSQELLLKAIKYLQKTH